MSGLMDTFATTVSVALQYGVPLRDLVNKFAHVRFEPSGFTGNSEIPIAKSHRRLHLPLARLAVPVRRRQGRARSHRSLSDRRRAALPARSASLRECRTPGVGAARRRPPTSIRSAVGKPATDEPKATALAAVGAGAEGRARRARLPRHRRGVQRALERPRQWQRRPRPPTAAGSRSTWAARRSPSPPRRTPRRAWTAARSWSATALATSASTAAPRAAAAEPIKGSAGYRRADRHAIMTARDPQEPAQPAYPATRSPRSSTGASPLLEYRANG